MTSTNIAEIHVLSLDGGGSRGIMESISLGHIMDLSTLMAKKPGKITEILRNSQLHAPEVGKKIQSLIELEKLSPIHPTEVFQYIVGKEILAHINPKRNTVFFGSVMDWVVRHLWFNLQNISEYFFSIF